jgi:ribosome-binding protein aMBF1 (putative translation factor)
VTNGERMRFAREEIGWSARKLAEWMGVRESSVRAIESDAYQPPEGVLERLEAIAKAHLENPPPPFQPKAGRKRSAGGSRRT